MIAHDEVYYVVSGEGDVTTDGVTTRMTAGDTAYLYDGGNVGITAAFSLVQMVLLAVVIGIANLLSRGARGTETSMGRAG